MKPIFDHISKRSHELNGEPLFAYLRDTKIDAADRLKFVPWVSHFVMTFADLYHFFLPVPQPKDRYEELINTHLAEEGSHWKWYLADLTNAGLDPTLRFTDALRLIWSDATICTRRLAYEMCRMSAGLSSLEKLVMVQAIEATGRVALEAAVPAGMEVEARSGRHLVYFGSHHLDTERAHTLEENDVQQSLEAIVIPPNQLERLLGIVDEVFLHFRGFISEAHHIAQSGRTLSDGMKDARAAAQAPS